MTKPPQSRRPRPAVTEYHTLTQGQGALAHRPLSRALRKFAAGACTFPSIQAPVFVRLELVSCNRKNGTRHEKTKNYGSGGSNDADPEENSPVTPCCIRGGVRRSSPSGDGAGLGECTHTPSLYGYGKTPGGYALLPVSTPLLARSALCW